jgi:hypothetical protein
VLFENYNERIDKINAFLSLYGIASIDEAKRRCDDIGYDVHGAVRAIQPICFDDACWAYTVGAAAVITKDITDAGAAARLLGEGLQSFCLDK